MSTLGKLEANLREAQRETNRLLKAREFDRKAYQVALARQANAELTLNTFRRLGALPPPPAPKPLRNCPLEQAALDAPLAYSSGYFQGWRSGQNYLRAVGDNLAPTPFFQASPSWIYGQLLREELTPFQCEHLPFTVDRFDLTEVD